MEMTKVYSFTSLVHSDRDACCRCRVTHVVDLDVNSTVVVVSELNTVDEAECCVLAEKLDERIHEIGVYPSLPVLGE